jgi:hypothetical protein
MTNENVEAVIVNAVQAIGVVLKLLETLRSPALPLLTAAERDAHVASIHEWAKTSTERDVQALLALQQK